MAASSAYVNPIDPQGYYCCSGFGHFPPSHSVKAKKSVTHKKSETQQMYTSTLSGISGKRGRNRRLAKSLPAVQVNRVPAGSQKSHKHATHTHKLARQSQRPVKGLSRRENDPTHREAVNYDRPWWELPKQEYKVRPTNFEGNRSYFKDLESNRPVNWLHPIERIIKKKRSRNHDTCKSDVVLKTPEDSSFVSAESYEEYSFSDSQNLSSEDLYFNTERTHPVQIDPLQTNWSYSRSRSGIRKPAVNLSSLNQVFAFDFESKNKKNKQNSLTTSLKDEDDNVDEPVTKTQSTTKQDKNKTTTKQDKNNTTKVPLPKISISSEILTEEKTHPQSDQMKQSSLNLLSLTSEWIKVLEDAHRGSGSQIGTYKDRKMVEISKNPSTLSIVDLGSFLQNSEALRAHYRELERRDNLQRHKEIGLEAATFSQLSPGGQFGQVDFGQLPLSDKRQLPSWQSSFGRCLVEPSEKPPNPYPDLAIFGHHLQSLLEAGFLSGNENEKQKLREMAKSAMNGQLNEEEVITLNSIAKEIQVHLSLPLPVQQDLLPPTHVSLKEPATSLVVETSTGSSLQDYSTAQVKQDSSTAVAKQDSSAADVEQDSLNDKEHNFSLVDSEHSDSHEDDDSTATNLHILHQPDVIMQKVDSQNSQSKNSSQLDSQLQKAYSKLENSVVLSVKEDLKYLKESMFMKPEVKQRESLLPPVKKKSSKQVRKRDSNFVNSHQPTLKVTQSSSPGHLSATLGQQLGCGSTSFLTPQSHGESVSRRQTGSRRSTASRQVTFSGVSLSRNGSSLSRGGSRSRVLLSSGRLPTPERSQIGLDFSKEIGDVRSLVDHINTTINPQELCISRPHTAKAIDSETDQRNKLSTRERASRGGSRRLSVVVEHVQNEDLRVRGKSAGELAREREERQRKMEQQLEESLVNKDSIRLRRRQLAEARKRAEELERERQKLLAEQQAQEMKKLAMEREKHAAVLEKLKLEAENRQYHQLCVEGILDDYNSKVDTWNEQDYAYYSHYLGQEYSERLRQEEERAHHLEKERLDRLVQEAIEFHRNELLRKLAEAQRNFMSGLEIEIEDLKHLLSISRAFVYSYFDKVSEQTYSVPEELL